MNHVFFNLLSLITGRMMWTVLVNDEHADRYYFEIDIFLPGVPSKRIVYRCVFNYKTE